MALELPPQKSKACKLGPKGHGLRIPICVAWKGRWQTAGRTTVVQTPASKRFPFQAPNQKQHEPSFRAERGPDFRSQMSLLFQELQQRRFPFQAVDTTSKISRRQASSKRASCENRAHVWILLCSPGRGFARRSARRHIFLYACAALPTQQLLHSVALCAPSLWPCQCLRERRKPHFCGPSFQRLRMSDPLVWTSLFSTQHRTRRRPARAQTSKHVSSAGVTCVSPCPCSFMRRSTCKALAITHSIAYFLQPIHFHLSVAVWRSGSSWDDPCASW